MTLMYPLTRIDLRQPSYLLIEKKEKIKKNVYQYRKKHVVKNLEDTEKQQLIWTSTEN